MNKKVLIGMITAIVVVVAIVGIVYNVNKDTSKSNEVERQMLSTDENDAETEDTIIEENKIEEATNEEEKEEKKEETTANNSKILIAYFSRADENYSVGTVSVGNTEIMAGFIKAYFGDGADTFKIEPTSPYPTNYQECTEVAQVEKNMDSRPTFKGDVDVSKYDTIFLRISCVVE